MRRSVFFLTPLLPLALSACEDGPNQTFVPATGTLFNNGDTPAAVSDAGDPFNSTFGGGTLTQICAGNELQQQWNAMVQQPIAPVRYMAGVDLDNGPTYPLLSVDQTEVGPLYPVINACVTEPTKAGFGFAPGSTVVADPCSANTTQAACAGVFNSTKGATACGWNVVPYLTNGAPANLQSNPPAPTRLCQPTVLGPGGNGSDVGGSIVSVWGNNQEFYMEWAVPTHKAYFLQLSPGYVGQMQWNYVTPSDGKMHYYTWEISLQMTKDGQPFQIGWSPGYAGNNQTATYGNDLDEIYRGIASTYAPDVYDNAAQGVVCNDTGTCLIYPNAYDGTGRALFGMRPVSFYFFFNPPTLPPPSGDIVQSGYAFNIKYAPYSGSTYDLRMYTDGGDQTYSQPIADTFVGNIGANSAPVECTFGMGNTFQNLLTNCIDVFAVSAKDKGTLQDPNILAQNKILGGLSHDDQNYSFYVVGINQNFRPVKLDVCTPALTAAGSNCGTDQQGVIHDTDTPLADPANNLANEFYTDVRSFGAIQNDYSPPGSLAYSAMIAAGGAPIPCTTSADCQAAGPQGGLPVHPYTGVSESVVCDTTATDPNYQKCVQVAYAKDYHGSGAVWREYARLAQTDLNAQYMALHPGNPNLFKSPHDARCYFPETCDTGVAADSTPSKCQNDSGDWVVAPLMEMTPYTACTAANAATVCTQAGATCNICTGGATQCNGIDNGACAVPFNANNWRPAPGCTGLEGWITAAEPIASTYPTDNMPTAADDLFDNAAFNLNLGGGGLAPLYGIGGGFKPGDPQGIMCADPGYVNAGGGLTGFNFCGLSGDTQGIESDLLGAAATRVLQYLGNGNVLAVPVEGRDRRYFFQQFATAYAKYLISNHSLDSGLAAKGATVLGKLANGLQVGDFSTQPLDSDNFIFDSIGGGASRSEFVDFDSADLNNDPVDVEMKAIILSMNLQNVDYYRKLDREERALFRTMATDTTQAPWGYLHNANGSYVTDNYLAGGGVGMTNQVPNGTANAGTTCTAATSATVCGTMTPPATCNTTGAAGDPTLNHCVYAFSRHNANPFLTNIAGSSVPTDMGYLPQGGGDVLGGYGGGTTNTPAPPGWADPCAPVSNPPAACNPSDALGGDTDCPSQTSLFGVPMSLYACVPTGGSATVGTCQAAMTPYYCATHADPACVVPGFAGNYPPLNDDGTIITRANGKPLLEGYCALFDALASPYALGSNNGIQVLKTFPDEGEALVSLPVYQNPYFPVATQNTNPIQVMVPWLPYQEGVGYPVAANGSQDVFVVTAQLDFTGQVITPTMDFLPVSATDPGNNNPQPPYGVNIMAWETQDFLGEVFLCSDTVTGANRVGTGRPGDLLTAHMYSSAETIVQWIGSHPNAQTNCGLIVRYSPYDNYPDYITSLSNGIRLDIEAGAGYGRVIDATVFTPGTGAAVSP